MDQVRTSLGRIWSDADRRRALLLSLVAHLCVLLLFVLWLSQPRPVPLDQFIVIDLGAPEQADAVVEAPTVDEAAPTSPTPKVADQETGEPQARTSPQEEAAAPERQARTEQPQPQPVPGPQPVPQPQPEAQTQPVPQPQTAEAPRTESESDRVEESEARGDPPVAPVPRVRQPEASTAAPDLPQATSAAVLPEIEEVELEPASARQAIDIPQPQAAARVPEARRVAVTPSVQVASARAVPVPDTAAEVAQAEPVPQPAATAQVATAEPIPQPQVAASVSEATSIPQPQAAAEVTARRPVPLPGASVDVAPARQVPMPGVQTQIAESRSVSVSAQANVAEPSPVPSPAVRAETTAPEPETGASLAGAAPRGNAPNPSNRVDERPAGGNAARSGQDRAAEDALAENLGRAADTAEGDATGAQSLRPTIPYREERERPLAVLLDNAAGYPQAGLTEASIIAEMPVEGGLTRLMTLYDQSDPAQVGPIRSARDYFVELARGYDGVLVHDGGSPAALAAIDRATVPTLNAFRYGELFSRQQGRNAPYNLYSSGGSLRDAVHRLRLDRSVELTGVVPRPPEETGEAEFVEVRYGGNYRSGFRYLKELDIYRWVRNGQNAVDYLGDAVFVEAVLVARIEARAIPDDPAGRLYIPLRGGQATLYLRGKAIEGRWSVQQDGAQGVTFMTSASEAFDLTPFRIWLLFAPSYSEVLDG